MAIKASIYGIIRAIRVRRKEVMTPKHVCNFCDTDEDNAEGIFHSVKVNLNICFECVERCFFELAAIKAKRKFEVDNCNSTQ